MARVEEAETSDNAENQLNEELEKASDGGSQAGDGGEEEEESEYEIESILDAKRGRFEKGKFGYLVKWKGYEEEHNSWVREEDAGNAADLIADFWDRKKKQSAARPSEPTTGKRRGRPSGAKATSVDESGGEAIGSDESESVSRSKKRSVSKTAPTENGNSAAKKKKKSLAGLDQDGDTEMTNGDDHTEEFRSMTKYMHEKNWEDLVKEVRTVERVGGDLMVFFELKSGENMREKSDICRKRFPQKLIQFYEDNLRWRTAEDTVL